jgi:cell fate (sporulation/competence/biofilm development) regulator YmcA (YheA/YmcA/DUF963 family)
MDKIIEEVKSLRNDIDSLPEIQEYYRLRELMEKDEELSRLRKEIARLTSEGKTEERKNLLAIYNSHPLVNNYNIAMEEAKSILRAIKDIIN